MVNKDMAESDLESSVETNASLAEQVSTLTKFVYFRTASVAKITLTKIPHEFTRVIQCKVM